jgi:hypothetical protein
MSYVIAVIRLPLEVHPDGTFTALKENVEFEFIPTKELPSKKENGIELASLELDEILGVFKAPEQTIAGVIESNIIIKLEKHIKRIKNKNTTFKNNAGNAHNYSNKRWRGLRTGL